MSKPKVPVTRHDDVLLRLREAFLTGQIEPGSRLIQEQLAERFGVSRIPLREALRTLQGEGLVEMEPNRGAVCRPLEAKDLSDLYAVRLVLETLAARSAAERFADLVAQTAAQRRLAEQAIGKRDLATLIRLDHDFHAQIARVCGNAHLERTLGGCWSQIMRGMHYFFTLERYPENVWKQHTAIARAISVGDTTLVTTLMESHIAASRDAILGSLQETHHEHSRA